MLIDMVEEVYKDISADDQGGAPADPFAEEMRKALDDSHKKMDELTEKIDKLAATGFSIDNENKEPEDGTENKNESEEQENEDQNS
jgi:hypothetical protein